ncbi:MAG: fructose-6-phosphate aldolase [Spirochaetes bacterium]|jgi:transaldolase|nr:fructose-6-phosphate aldolase [Spirochaetota bacterium]
MKFFLDTADLQQIEDVKRLGMLDGVTTNPTHVSKTGANPSELYPKICKMVDGPVSLETVGLDADTIVDEGRTLAKIADNVVVKVPIMKEGLVAVKRLTAEGIRTNVTVTFSASQALLAAKAGASYISPFVGRLDNVSTEGMELARQIRQIYDNYGFETELLVAAARHPIHVVESALIGADVITLSYDILMMLYDHPLTDAGIETFLKDWEKVPK